MKRKLITLVGIFLALVGIFGLVSLVVFNLQQEVKSKELIIEVPKVSFISASADEIAVDVTLRANLGVKGELEKREQEEEEEVSPRGSIDLKMTGRVCLNVEPFNLGIGPFSRKVGPLYFEVPFEKVKKIILPELDRITQERDTYYTELAALKGEVEGYKAAWEAACQREKTSYDEWAAIYSQLHVAYEQKLKQVQEWETAYYQLLSTYENYVSEVQQWYEEYYRR